MINLVSIIKNNLLTIPPREGINLDTVERGSVLYKWLLINKMIYLNPSMYFR